MAVLHGRDLLTSKFITAIISDSSSRAHFVPIKHTIGDYFLTVLDKQMYVFKLVGSEIKTYRQTAIKSFRVLFYDTTHYRPIATDMCKELELVLDKNSLPRLNMMLFKILKAIGRQQRPKSDTYEIADFKAALKKYEDHNPDGYKNITNFLDNLAIDNICTPVRKIGDFIEDDLLDTDSGFLGTIISHFQRTDVIHKKVTNQPIGSKTAWLKWIAIFSLVGLVLAIIYMAYEQGAFDGLMKLGEPFGSVGEAWKSAMQGTGPKPQDVMSQFTPEQLKAAIDRGEVNPDSLPPDIRKLVEGVKLPTVSENP